MEYFVDNNNQVHTCGTCNNITIGYKHYAEGVFILAKKEGSPIIQHNAGFVPKMFFVIAKNFEGEFTFNAENRPQAGIYGYKYSQLELELMETLKGSNMNYVPQRSGSSLEWRNNNSTGLGWTTNNNNAVANATENTIRLGYRAATYAYLPGIEYHWYALA